MAEHKAFKKIEDVVIPGEQSARIAARIWIPGRQMAWIVNGRGFGAILPPAIGQRMQLDWTFEGMSHSYPMPHTKLAGPVWSENSCAFDVVLELFLRIGAGLIHYDQLPPATLSRLSPIQREAMLYVARGGVRNGVTNSSAFSKVYKDLTGDYSAFHSTLSILERSATAFPQLLLKCTTGQCCSDPSCRYTLAGNHQPDTSVFVQAFAGCEDAVDGDKTPLIERQLRGWFGNLTSGDDDFCPRPGCRGYFPKARLVGGSLPPRLLFAPTCDALEWTEASSRVSIEYLSVAGDKSIDVTEEFVKIGMIFMNPDLNHFMLCWGTDLFKGRARKWLLYDGMEQNGEYQLLDSFNSLRQAVRGGNGTGTPGKDGTVLNQTNLVVYEKAKLFEEHGSA